jgi:hypothetical protein
MKNFYTFLACFFSTCANAQGSGTHQGESIDTLNVRTSRRVLNLLSVGKAEKAFQLFNIQGRVAQKEIRKELERVSNDIRKINSKTESLVQVSYRNYKDSFNINRVLLFNRDGQYYLFELFYQAGDRSSYVVGLFVKDPAALARKRKQVADFRKGSPDLPMPPQSLPPRVYITESN